MLKWTGRIFVNGIKEHVQFREKNCNVSLFGILRACYNYTLMNADIQATDQKASQHFNGQYIYLVLIEECVLSMN